MRCSFFRGRWSTLDASIVILRGKRSTLDVSRCVFLRILMSELCQVATRCRFRGRRGILWDVMKLDGSLARNIDFEVANFKVLRKIRRKTSILKLQSVKIGGSLAWNARLDAPTCLVSSLWFSCGLAVSMGEAAKPLLFEDVQAGCHVVLRGRRGTLWQSNLFDNVSKVILCGKRNTFESFSEDEVHFSWQVSHFGDLHRHFAWQAQHLRRVVLRALHSTLRTLRSTLHPLHFTLHTLHSTLRTLHFTLYTPHCTLHIPHFTLYTLHSAHSTLHFTLYTRHFTLHTPHSLCAYIHQGSCFCLCEHNI